MTVAVPVRDAATVMVVRDAAPGAGPEVLMLRRRVESVFVPGAYVFPGGAVDDADGSGDVAFRVAAIRETFEEAGLLLAYSDDGELVRLDDPDVAARFTEHRRALNGGERSLTDVCKDEGLRLALDHLHYLSRWITPEGAPRRYDTRFFVCSAPPGQTPLHDDHETIAQVWIAAAAALERSKRGEYELILPTQRSLETMSRYPSATAFLDAVAAGGA